MPYLNCKKRKVYSAFGFILESEINIPGLIPIGCNTEPDVTVVFGKVPGALGDTSRESFIHTYSYREAILRLDSELQFYVGHGRTIIIEASDSVPEDKITAILLDFPFAVLLNQRGFFVLHGATVIVDSLAVSFLGRSGEGKSALVHELWRKGYTIVGDDICAVKMTDDGPLIFSGIYRLSVWRDTIDASGGLDERYIRVRDGIHKYFIDFSDMTDIQPVRPNRFYFLYEGNEERFSVEKVKGFTKMNHMTASVLHHEISEKIFGREEMFRVCTEIMGSVKAAAIHKNSDLLTVADFTDAVIAEVGQ